MLGVYLSGHPLDDYAEAIRRIETITTEALIHEEESDQVPDGATVTLAGIIATRKTLVTKKNNMMAFLQLEDLKGSVEVIVFPNVYERCRDLIREDQVIVVHGKINRKEDEAPKVLAEKISAIDDIRNLPGSVPVKLRIPEEAEEAEMLEKMKLVMTAHPGDTPVLIYFSSCKKCLKASTNLWVTPSDDFFRCMETLIGKENIKG